MTPARVLLVAAAFVALLAAGASTAMPQDTGAMSPKGGDSTTEKAPPQPGAGTTQSRGTERGAERGAERGSERNGERGSEDGPSRGNRRFSAESLTPEQIDEVIDVAADISPEWGTALRAKREQDPQGLREAIASGGPRLLGLLVLKRNHPELYAIRVEDLRLQSELKALASEYRAAIEAGSAKAAELEAQLRQKVNRQVDLDLRARAIELKALDAQVRRMVDELTQEARDRTGRVDKVLEAIKAGEEPRSLVRPGFGSGERGGRSWRRPGPTGGEGNESRADPAPGGGSAPKNGAAPSGGAAKNGAAPSGRAPSSNTP